MYKNNVLTLHRKNMRLIMKRDNTAVRRIFSTIESRMKEMNVSFYRLKKDLDISEVTLTRLRRGIGGCNVNTIARIAEYFGMELVLKQKEENEDNN